MVKNALLVHLFAPTRSARRINAPTMRNGGAGGDNPRQSLYSRSRCRRWWGFDQFSNICSSFLCPGFLTLFCGIIYEMLILSPKKESKIGAKEPENRQNLVLRAPSVEQMLFQHF